MAAKHELWAAKPSPRKPKAEITAAPSSYEVTHPVGSAERFLDQAAKEALAAAAAGGIPKVRQLVPGAVKAMAKAADKYPDPLLSEAARLPAEELARRAARAEAFRRTMQANDTILREVSQALSPGETLAKIQLAAGIDSAVQGAARQDAKGGRTVRAAQGAQEDTPPVDAEVPSGQPSGPRIVINPTTFRNSKDALCVAFNEGFRLWMEATGFEPQSEPTAAQRKFFSDTAYADDELQLRRTILARIATFDTSVKDPTDNQLAETASFLNAVLESDWCKNEWERNSVQKLARAVEAAVGAEPVEPRAEPVEPREPEPLRTRAAEDGGEARRTLAMNGPALEPARRIGDIGARTLTDPKRMNGPSTEPGRPIGDIGELSFTDTGSMNGPSVEPDRPIGDIGARTLTDSKRMNGPATGPERPIGDVGELSFTDTKRMNGPALEPARRLGDIGARSLSPTTPDD